MVIIIGGGITGLSLAYFLRAKGCDVMVIEKDKQLGGNATWTKLGKFTADSFYHVITNRDIHFLNLVRELRLEQSLFPVKLKMGFFSNKKIYPISTLKEFMIFPPLSFKNRIKLASLIMRSRVAKDWKKLESITAAEWLSSVGGQSNYKKLWEPIMKSKFGQVTEKIAATDMVFRINRMSGIRDRDFKEKAYSMRGTLKTFFDKFEDILKNSGVIILKDSAVNKINVKDGRILSVLLNNKNEIVCDSAISTIPLPDFIRILPDNYEGYPSHLKTIEYLNNVCLIIRLKQRFSPYYQINLGDTTFPFTGVIGADALYLSADFEQSYVLCVSKYFIGEDKAFDMDERDLLKYYLPYLAKLCPGFNESWVLDITLTKKRNVEPIHSLYYSKVKPSFTTPIKDLYLLCTAQIYPEPTVLDASVKYAKKVADKFF